MIQALSSLSNESSQLKEDFFEYTLVCLKARQDWVPFGNLIKDGRLFQDVHFGKIEMKTNDSFMPSNLSGNYREFGFKFTYRTLKVLAK